MRNFILFAVIGGLGLGAASVSAHDFQSASQIALTWPWADRLADSINQVNRMRGHVRWEFRNHRSNHEIRRDFLAISREIDRVNSDYRRAGSNRRKLRHDIEHARQELHRIELRLHVRPRDYYPWR